MRLDGFFQDKIYFFIFICLFFVDLVGYQLGFRGKEKEREGKAREGKERKGKEKEKAGGTYLI